MELRDADRQLTALGESIQRAPVSIDDSNLGLLKTAFLYPSALIPSVSVRRQCRVRQAINRKLARKPYRHAQDAIGCNRKELSREQRRQSNRHLPVMPITITSKYHVECLRPAATDTATVETQTP